MLMDEEHVQVQQGLRQEFTREQKFGYAVVIACGVLAVTFGMFYMVKHVKAPFIISYTGNKLLTGDDAKAAEVAAQKAADTDGDTVSDYDEANIYGSSPYLTDTDSDGTSDNVEIANNMDPACAKGAACEDGSDTIVPGSSIDDGMLGDQIAATSAEIAAAEAQAAQLEQMKAMLKGLTPEEIRTTLVSSGADKAQLDAMTDAEVTALYQSVVSELEASGGLEQLLQQAQGASASTDSTGSSQASSGSTTTTPTP